MPLRFSFAARSVVARIGLADVRRVRTSALERVVAIIEVVVAHGIAAERRIIVQRRQFQRSAALPAAEQARAQQLRFHSEPCRMMRDEIAELGHFLLEPPEHHVRPVAQRHVRAEIGDLVPRIIVLPIDSALAVAVIKGARQFDVVRRH